MPRYNRPPSSPEFIYRDATPEDREEVLAFTANTWEHGDYISDVYDEWLKDSMGRFLVAVEASTGRIAALDKLSFIRRGEAWFEGLRVNPEFRGLGLASRTQRFMIEEAHRRGARTIRFLTRANNHAVHSMAYRDGFHLRMIVRFWRWTPDMPDIKESSTRGERLELRPAEPPEAASLYEWWLRSGAFASHGLVYGNWRYGNTTPAEWEESARRGMLFVAADYSPADAHLPPASVLMNSIGYHTDPNRWWVSALGARTGEMAPLLASLVDRARTEGATEIIGFFPETVGLYHALEAAGFEADPGHESYSLFELVLGLS